ncbi:MAG TPA: hypothetical protein VEU94_18230, partial [Terriglobales bacterium]|nr:hypothetical protein [Terriglobales bacterium]
MRRRAVADNKAVGRLRDDGASSDAPREELRKRRREIRAAKLDPESRPKREKRKNVDRLKGKASAGAGETSSRASSISEVHPEHGSHKFPVAIIGADAGVADRLFSALANRFSPLPFERAARPSDADLVISIGVGDWPARHKRNQITVIVDAGNESEGGSSSAHAAKTSGSLLLRLEPLLCRYGLQWKRQDLTISSDDRCKILADAIRQRVVGMQAGIALASGIATTPEDLAAALALSASPADLLKALDWPGKGPPKLWRMLAEPRTVQALLGGKVSLPGGRRQRVVPLPINWKTELPEMRSNALLHSLDIVSGLLVYWLQKANRVSSNATSQIDKAVKKRNITASTLLGSAGDLILDFLQHEPQLPDSAWSFPVVQRRICVLSLYLLCCRTAAMRRIRFDEARCGPVFRSLLEGLERIRSSAEWPLGTSAGVANAALLVSLALPLRNLTCGALLFDQSLSALRECQLAKGMSADGFWREGIAQQGEALATLRLLCDDLRQAEVSCPPIQVAMLNLAGFASTLLQEDGTCPPINEWPPIRQVSTLRSASAVLRASASRRKSGDAPSAASR